MRIDWLVASAHLQLRALEKENFITTKEYTGLS